MSARCFPSKFVSMKLTIQLLLTLVISLALTTVVIAEDDAISIEELEKLPPFPPKFDTLSYLERVNWLNERINEDISDVKDNTNAST